VTDNAQSIYELSLIEQVPNVKEELKKDFNIDVNFDAPRICSRRMTARQHFRPPRNRLDRTR